jgi:1-aminocyclopropane-1-carboxylate deaminase/D-cysteine desulfhydrase-like pyridoxal-dependent ACC family enzyme
MTRRTQSPKRLTSRAGGNYRGAVYGGNKVRMLEFLLGGALRANAKEVVTVGYAGSNQALALALYADRLGLKCSSYLLPQANAPSGANNPQLLKLAGLNPSG